MHVLVSAASRHGSSAEIARTIGAVLGTAGLEVTVAAPRDVTTVDGFDAVVLGSGVYAGHWLTYRCSPTVHPQPGGRPGGVMIDCRPANPPSVAA